MTVAPTRIYAVAALTMLLCAFAPGSAPAIDPRFELDPRLLDKGTATPVRQKEGRAGRKAVRAGAGSSDYTIRPGDHIFKILMKEYGLSNNEAEALIPEVKRLNEITDIRRLRVGQTIRIPLARGGERTARSVAAESPARTERPQPAAPPASAREEREGRPAGHSLRMMSVAADRESEGIEATRQLWNGLVPPTGRAAQPVNIEDKNFSLSLDPESFPSFPAADGGRVLVDAGGKLPPLVRALIEEKDPSIRIVSENPRNQKRFMASLLAGARFYSVEENISLEFGADPKLTVNADFKIEKTADSLMRHDVVLMNVGEHRRGMPASLVQYLQREGFQVVEPFPAREERNPRREKALYQITARETRGIVDALLRALNVHYDTDRNVELYGMGDGGIRLFVRADRYYEEGGDRYVVSYFDGDPVTYTLTRLLETRGYRVIVLDPADGFRKVSEKLFSRMRIPGVFAKQELLPARDSSYGIQMSGFRMRGPAGEGETAFLTNSEIDPLFRDLLDHNGYNIVSY